MCKIQNLRGPELSEEKISCFIKERSHISTSPGRPVISNYGTPTGKVPECLDSHLKPIMQNNWSYIRDSGNFIDKIKRIKNIPKDAILVTADVIGSYPFIPHVAGLKVLKNAHDARKINLSKLKMF